MGSFSIWHWLIVLMVVLLLFGSGKISGLMGDFAKGIKSFKQNIKEDDKPSDASMTAESAPPASPMGGTISAPLGSAPAGATTTNTAQASSTNPRPAA
jgi:sec-independent protein translocase protein TatA